MISIRIAVIFILSNAVLSGQSILKGTVADESNNPIPGVNILNISNGKHTHSNEEGVFRFEEVKVGDTLYFSHIGFDESEIFINSLTEVLNVVLSSSIIDISEITITRGIDALNLIADIDIQTNPVSSSQEVLRKVPGLFIGQHAGGGKAEQIFLRGFDIDHGTDVSLTVDGLPVNMVSHAHGQGYSDLHFVIPETINKLDFGKGPYYADIGNFNTAGYVNIRTRERLDNSLFKAEFGAFNTNRLLSMFNLVSNGNHNSYVAAEHILSDGPFDSPQNFNRTNIFGKYSGHISDTDKIGVTTSFFSSKWDASGQIPQRAVDDGSIGRFGAIDDTEGGNTSRTNVLVTYDRFIDKNSIVKNSIYFSRYDFELYSNFTFYLEDPINGDQIRQKEVRNIYGLNSEYNHMYSMGEVDGSVAIGVSLRNDQSSDNELSYTRNRRETLRNVQWGDINETNMGGYFRTIFDFGKWTLNSSVRVDHFNFEYNDLLQTNYETQSQSKTIISPKFNILYNYSRDLQLYFKSGKGFHSNDTRVVVNKEGEEILPAAYGIDIGYIWKPSAQWFINMAYWYLFLEQEFVYVGDAGIVEPSGKTQRKGVDLSLRYQPIKWLFWNLDANYTYARTTDSEEDQDHIPLAPDFTLISGINLLHQSGWYGGVHMRFMNDRPANEDNSIVAEGYSVIDINTGYKWKNIDLSLQIQNVLDTEWNETQFATESRLLNESESVEEIHFTPGTPFFVKGMVAFSF